MQEHQQLRAFLQCESTLRAGLPVPQGLTQGLNQYWKDLTAVLDWFRLARLAGGYGAMMHKIPEGIPYSSLLRNLSSGTWKELHAESAAATG